MFNLNNLLECTPCFLCLDKFREHSDQEHQFWNQKDPFWVQVPSLTSHQTFPESFISVKWGPEYPSLRTVCVCAFDLLSTVPAHCEYSAAPYIEPSITPPPGTHMHLLLPSFSDYLLWSPTAVTCATHNLALPWLDMLWEVCVRARRKRVNNGAASVKRLENEGDKGKIWRSKKEFATKFVSDSS